MIKVFDDLIDLDLSKEIESIFLSESLPWIYNDHTSHIPVDEIKFPQVQELPQMVHPIIQDGNAISSFINPAMNVWNKLVQKNNLQVSFVLRVKLNLNMRQSESKVFGPHRDHDNPRFFSAIYYVNDTDGDTYFFEPDGKIIKQVSPKRGKIVFFPSNILHAGSSPTKHNRRVVINYIFSINS